jgi:AraC-like DNA-binding protein
VEIAALLLAPDLPRARVAIGVGHTVHTVSSVAELDTVLRTRPVDIVVLDPVATGVDDTQTLGSCLARHDDVPVIAYVSVSPAGMRRAMAVAMLGVRRVVLRGHDDQPAAFRALLDGAHADTLAAHVVTGLAAALTPLPSTLRRAIERVFRAPHTFRTAGDLARAAGLPPRTCSRLLARAGLASPRTFVGAARVVCAYHGLRGGRARVVDVALRLGYGTSDALVRDTRRASGLRPTALAHRVAPDALVALIVRRLGTRATSRPQLAVVPRDPPTAVRPRASRSLQPASA